MSKSSPSAPDAHDPDPALRARAQAAMDELAGELEGWAADSVARLDAARARLNTEEESPDTLRVLHRRAHDLKGLGTTYGYPLLTRICTSLCRLFEEGGAAPPAALIETHVDAALAVKAEHVRDDDAPAWTARCQALEAATQAALERLAA